MAKPKVLFVINDPRFFLTHRVDLALGLEARGYAVAVASPHNGYEEEIRRIIAAGFRVHPIAIERQGLNPLKDLRVVWDLTTLYRETRPDIVHHVTVKPVVYGSVAARLAKVPTVINAVSGLGRLLRSTSIAGSARAHVVRTIYRVALRHPNMTAIFQNEEDRSIFVDTGIVPEGSTILIEGSGTNLALFDPAAEPESPPIVLLPARILRQKGIREFVSAARSLRRSGVGARFAIVGDTAGNRDALSKRELDQIREEGIVELWGWTDNLPAAMGRAAIVCLPSYHEGLPKALIDACAAGRPVVATNIAGCRAVVSDGLNGLLVPPRNSAALASALRTLIEDEQLRRMMGARGRSIAEKRFDVALVIRSTVQLYQTVATKRVNWSSTSSLV